MVVALCFGGQTGGPIFNRWEKKGGTKIDWWETLVELFRMVGTMVEQIVQGGNFGGINYAGGRSRWARNFLVGTAMVGRSRVLCFLTI